MVNEIFVRCKCGAEGMNITLDDETGDVFFSIWYYIKPKLTILRKLIWIMNIIRGKPYPDEVIVDKGWLPLIIDKLGSMRVEAEQKHGK